MFGVPYDSAVAHRRGETNRCDIKVPAAHVLLESVDELGRAHSRTRSKFALDATRHKQFHVRAADIDDQDFSLHERPSPKAFGMNLSVASARAAKTLKEAWLLRLCRRTGRPAFHYFEGKKPEQQLPCRFQIEPQILGNLLHGPGTIELRRELGLV